ncbi:ATP-dependent Lon protease pim1 [Balamuthia mandrillaris]
MLRSTWQGGGSSLPRAVRVGGNPFSYSILQPLPQRPFASFRYRSSSSSSSSPSAPHSALFINHQTQLSGSHHARHPVCSPSFRQATTNLPLPLRSFRSFHKQSASCSPTTTAPTSASHLCRRSAAAPSLPRSLGLSRHQPWFMASRHLSGNGAGDNNGRNNDEPRFIGLPNNSIRPLHPGYGGLGSLFQKLGNTPTPRTVPVLPLNLYPIFSGIHFPAIVDSKWALRLQQMMSEGQPFVGLFLTKDIRSTQDITDPSEIHSVGQLGYVLYLKKYSEGSELWYVFISSMSRRIRATSPVPATAGGGLSVNIEEVKEPAYNKDDPVIQANYKSIEHTIRQLHVWEPAGYYLNFLENIDKLNPSEATDLAAAFASLDPYEQQEILETLDVKERQAKTLALLQKRLQILARRQDSRGTAGNVYERQRKDYLESQKRNIEKQLGMDGDEKDKFLTDLSERLNKIKLPEEVQHVVDEEMNKLSSLEKGSSEYGVTRQYLQWISQLPWGLHKQENLNLHNAKNILDEDHYGLKDVKERILEFLAVGKLKGSVQGKILCFVGPPGVGKTSIGRSIARALDRDFFRFSVGGMHDVTEIKGHRRTYIGAMPGKIIQSMKNMHSANPVILIDEIDKLGTGFHGDPASALLEVLDPEQNSAFLDHYLDLPFDLSKVLFVCTANETDTIPGPLLDRMEVVRLSGYIHEEKMQIAKKHIIPKARSESGLKVKEGTIKDGALRLLIQQYCREAGVRDLQKQIEKIFRKIAFQVARHRESSSSSSSKNNKRKTKKEEEGESQEETSKQTLSIVVTEENLSEFVGQPKFISDRFYDETPPGVVMGLAWTSMGGATLYIETVNDRFYLPSSEKEEATVIDGEGVGVNKEETKQNVESDQLTEEEGGDEEGEEPSAEGSGSFTITGQLGDVMKESTHIAHTYAKNLLSQIAPENKFFNTASLHMHIPEGATPKDGPSAGCTMVTSLLSLAMQRAVRNDIAMTGELTLTGKVLPIGGVKEKTIAAKRSSVKHIIFPADNKKDWEELDEEVRRGLVPHFVSDYRQIYELCFPSSSSSSPKKESKGGRRKEAAQPSGAITPQMIEEQKKKKEKEKEKKTNVRRKQKVTSSI